MKFLVLAACVAVSSAQGFFGLQAHPNGAVTPIDEPAVAAARADHLATKFGAGLGYAGYGAGLGYAGLASGYAAAAPIVAATPVAVAPVDSGLGYAGYAPYASGYGYAGPLNLNSQLVAHPNGAVVPVDEPAVAAARADHLASKGVAYAAAAPLLAAAPIAAGLGYAGYAPYAAGYGYAGPLNLNSQLVAHPNGAVVPVDEPAVAAARADHLASKGVAYAAAAPLVAAAPAIAAAPLVASAPYAAVGYGYGGPLNLNTQLVAHPNGAVVPVDEPAVAAARADHLATKGVYGGVYAAAAPAAYAAGYGAGYAPYAGLVAHPNGAVVPVDEPAVAAARADHLAAHGY